MSEYNAHGSGEEGQAKRRDIRVGT